jgi:hypothetical protein
MSDIYTAMLEAANKIGYVQKKGRNTAQSYNYAGEADFIEAMRPELLAAGICPPHVIDITDNQVTVIPKGQDKSSIHVSRVYTFRYYHAASKTFVDVKAAGEGNDALDKASYKAATGALKYALRQTFLIETGNDPDDVKPPSLKERADVYINFIKGVATSDELARAQTKGRELRDELREKDKDLFAKIVEAENNKAKEWL